MDKVLFKISPWIILVFLVAGGIWLERVLPAWHIPNAGGTTENLILVAMLLPFTWRALRISHEVKIIILAVIAVHLLDCCVLAMKSIAYLVAERTSVEWVVSARWERFGQYTGIRPETVYAYLDSGHFYPAGCLFMVQACISAPLWEELVRGYAHRALAGIRLPTWLRVVLVASAFSAVHIGHVLSTLPGFIVLGCLAEAGISWGSRAVIHAAMNALVLLDALTLYLGGTRLYAFGFQILSLAVQCIFCISVAAWCGWLLARRLKRRVNQATVMISTSLSINY